VPLQRLTRTSVTAAQEPVLIDFRPSEHRHSAPWFSLAVNGPRCGESWAPLQRGEGGQNWAWSELGVSRRAFGLVVMEGRGWSITACAVIEVGGCTTAAETRMWSISSLRPWLMRE
jgi:hypothetical protein